MRSKLFRLNSRDFWKGLVVAVLTGFFTACHVMFSSGQDLTVRAILWPTLAAFFGYIGKNLLEDDKGEILGDYGNSL